MIPSSTSFIIRLVDVLVRFRFPILAASAVASLLAIFPASRLTFNQSLESLYADDDPHLRDYLASRRLFGGDELVGVVYRDPELFERAGLDRVAGLAADLSKIRGVKPHSTQDLASNLEAIERQLFKTLFRKEMESFRLRAVELLRRVLVGDDDHTTAVIIRLEAEGEALCPRAETVAAIREVAETFPKAHGLATHVAGEPVQIHDMFRYVEEDGKILGWTSTALLVAVILVLFRRLRWVLLPILIVQGTLLWTKAILVFSGIQLTMVSSVLESLITIMGVATVMHMSLVYCELRRDFDRVAALQRTLELLAVDIFWVCATTAAGFAAELASHVYPVRSFGVI